MFKGYRTIIFNLAMPVLAILVAVGVLGPEESPDATQINVFLDNLEVVVTGFWAAGNLVLRKVTTGPVGTTQ